MTVAVGVGEGVVVWGGGWYRCRRRGAGGCYVQDRQQGGHSIVGLVDLLHRVRGIGDGVVVIYGVMVWRPCREPLTQFQPWQRKPLGSIRVHEKGPGICRAVVDDPYAESKRMKRAVAARPGFRSDSQPCDCEVGKRWTIDWSGCGLLFGRWCGRLGGRGCRCACGHGRRCCSWLNHTCGRGRRCFRRGRLVRRFGGWGL